jgi:DNA-binding CsgD family transcriptional regulator
VNTTACPGGRALVYETEGLVAERVRQMLAAEGLASCVVDDAELFHELRASGRFDLYVVGVRAMEGLQALELGADVQPLVVLAPLHEVAGAAPYRLVAPAAGLVDRGLRDPDAIRAVVGLDSPAEATPPGPDALRTAFLPFGLSERQLEVLAGALTGETSREIAGKLFISELTVRNHLHAIYERVGVSGRRELLGRFVQGLIEGHA